MDQKNQGNNPGQDQQKHGGQTDPTHKGQGDTQQHDRDQAEGSRENVRGDQKGKRGKGSQGEQNRESGISNRAMDSSREQRDLPSRGSGRESDR